MSSCPEHVLSELIARVEPASDVDAMRALERVRGAVPEDMARTLAPLAAWLAGATHSTNVPTARKTVLVVGADRAGEDSCAQQLDEVATGRAPVCAAARGHDVAVVAVDAGLREDATSRAVLSFRIGDGARDFRVEPAMTDDQAAAALQTGFALVFSLADGGLDVLGVGAIDAVSIRSAVAVIDQVAGGADAMKALAGSGGFDIGVLAGAIAGAASIRVPVVIDGIATAAAAMIATGLAPEARRYILAAHAGQLEAHRNALEQLGLEPLFPQGISRGDGAGAVLAMPLVASAAQVLREIR